jgi:ABC-2 type transport system ATP-binding protein
MVNHVSKKFGSTVALADVTLEVGQGVLGLAGVNGSGKTTLLQVLAGNTKPTTGIVGVDDGSAGLLPMRKRRLGVLPQSFTFPAGLVITDFVAYSAWLKGHGKKASDLARGALDRVGLSPDAKTPLGRASGGMVRRAGFAAAIVDDPHVLLLDEPTTGVDPEQRQTMRRLIAENSATRITVMSSHVCEDIESLCEKFVILDAGAVAFSGTPSEAKARVSAGSLEDAIVRIPRS